MADRAATIERLRPRYAEHAAGLGPGGRGGARLPAALEGGDRRGARGGARRAHRRRPPARLHRPRPAPRRHRVHPRRPRPARLRLPRPAAARAARRCCSPSARSWPRSAARAPLMLLDDPMSELDAGRRERLVEVLRRGGQSVIAATELGLVPGADARGRRRGSRSSTAPSCRRRSGREAPAAPRGPSRRPLERVADAVMPATLLAEVQRVWPAAAGPRAGGRRDARLRARRRGRRAVRIGGLGAASCDLLSAAASSRRLNRELGRPAVTGLRADADARPSRDFPAFCSDFRNAVRRRFRGVRLLD